MAVYKRGDTYWYEFLFNGERIRQSAQTGNKDVARQIESAHRVRLAKGEAGIVERPPASTDAIDEAAIDAYKQRRTRQASRYGRPLMPASVNRELATLRRALRLAQEWKVIDRVPRIRLLRGERNREFVLSHRLEPVYLEVAPQPLKDVAILVLEMGVRPGEAIALRW